MEGLNSNVWVAVMVPEAEVSLDAGIAVMTFAMLKAAIRILWFRTFASNLTRQLIFDTFLT